MPLWETVVGMSMPSEVGIRVCCPASLAVENGRQSEVMVHRGAWDITFTLFSLMHGRPQKRTSRHEKIWACSSRKLALFLFPTAPPQQPHATESVSTAQKLTTHKCTLTPATPSAANAGRTARRQAGRTRSNTLFEFCTSTKGLPVQTACTGLGPIRFPHGRRLLKASVPVRKHGEYVYVPDV